MSYPGEDDSRITESGKQALRLMAQRGVALHPRWYAIWFEYSLGLNERLIGELDRAIETGIPLSPQFHDQLYDKYLAPQPLNGTGERVVGETQILIRSILEKLMQATNFSAQQRDQLDAVSVRIHEATDISQVHSLVDQVLEHAGKMVASSRDLQQRLQEESTRAQKLNEMLEQARRDATTDSLTGLFNRKALDGRVEDLMVEHLKAETPLSLVMLDIDHFKRINDTYGHSIGDAVLRFVSKSITQFVRGNDFAARYGGEEFAVLLPHTALDQAVVVAENIRRGLENNRLKIVRDNKLLPAITVSAGVSMMRQNDTVASLFERADKALYQAKNSGRNAVKYLR